jgi:hypothetical protein
MQPAFQRCVTDCPCPGRRCLDAALLLARPSLLVQLLLRLRFVERATLGTTQTIFAEPLVLSYYGAQILTVLRLVNAL